MQFMNMPNNFNKIILYKNICINIIFLKKMYVTTEKKIIVTVFKNYKIVKLIRSLVISYDS